VTRGTVSETGDRSGTPPLARLVEVARGLAGILDPDHLLEAILDGVIALAGADRGAVLLGDREGGFVVRAGRDREGCPLPPEGLAISRSVLLEVADSRRAVLVDDVTRADTYRQRESILALNLRAILCAPLVGSEGTLGLLYADSQLVARRFTDEDRDLLEAFAAVAAVALESVRLLEVRRERDRMSLELDHAAQIQRSFLPSGFPRIPGWRGAALARPAGRVGGDLHDFVELADGRTAVIAADVSGKGVPAALTMARVVSWIRGQAPRSDDFASLLVDLNGRILREADGERFVTLVAAILSTDSDEVDLVGCGHPAPLLVRRGEVEEAPGSSAPPLGLDEVFAPASVRLRLGDAVLLGYTDGALDAVGAGGEAFGLGRLVAAAAGSGSPEEIVSSSASAIDRFAGPTGRTDDLTLVAVGRESP
jgi:sigma-B regulation protein RsbU (phosphoserine phosphatase)